MTAILARLPGVKGALSHDSYAWYARALSEGYGIAVPIPPNDETTLDLLMGLFEVFRRKRLERDTFFVAVASERNSPTDIAHATEMVELFPSDAMLVVNGTTSNGGIWIDVENDEIENKEVCERLERAVAEAHKRGNKVAIDFRASPTRSDESYRQAVEKLLAFMPTFIVTDRPRHARMVVDAHKIEPWLKTFLRSRPIWYLRGRIGYYRTLVRTRPFYWLIYLFESFMGKLISIHTRPLYARDYTNESDTLRNMPPCAIVMQGPIMHRRNFTLETIRLYKKLFPTVHVILSTWDDEDPSALAAVRECGAEIVLSRPPEYRGPGNTNLQLASSLAGMRYAKKLGARYAVKQRTDYRIYNPRAMEFMLNLLATFPPGKHTKQHARVVATGSSLNQPYQFGEFLFGDIEDMEEYYSCPPIKKDEKFDLYVVENYIPAQFLKRNGWDLKWTIEDGWRAIRECFVTLEWSDLDIYWYKYHYRYDEYQNQRHYTKRVPAWNEVGFDAWLNIYQGYENKALRPSQRIFHKLVSNTEELD